MSILVDAAAAPAAPAAAEGVAAGGRATSPPTSVWGRSPGGQLCTTPRRGLGCPPRRPPSPPAFGGCAECDDDDDDATTTGGGGRAAGAAGGAAAARRAEADLNARGVYLHLLGDALGSVGAIASGAIIRLAPIEWRVARALADPLASLAIVAILLCGAVPLVAVRPRASATRALRRLRLRRRP